MARRNRNKILVPEAREGLDQLKTKVIQSANPGYVKYEIAREQGIPLQEGYNGNLTSKDAGTIGGSVGGNMVKELVKMGEQQLLNKNK
ncbi:small, acid-soluble spore protein, alpha/beta type [Pontibacillus yanchengensis]|uniref:Small, acid-soluble spore protein, alpha/beta type n=2 Tax=Pontibacillus yanchengensis TaxID=462910 RepID=A0ACC7VE64_9BACI|nr:alpha/beta-type small acid-soluble spore protein [Pontibacillus yanchengensis]MYL35389.1 small, acid-soluble spore protein, alpha/beta type [Pontibacillus yanchengensis]MYL52420.1 small, acid-soluble spore protein, alpha/beta type [Pontibacillus yanchengensis]